MVISGWKGVIIGGRVCHITHTSLRLTLTRCRSMGFIIVPWKNSTVVKCLLNRPSSSRSGGFLHNRHVTNMCDIHGCIYSWWLCWYDLFQRPLTALLPCWSAIGPCISSVTMQKSKCRFACSTTTICETQVNIWKFDFRYRRFNYHSNLYTTPKLFHREITIKLRVTSFNLKLPLLLVICRYSWSQHKANICYNFQNTELFSIHRFHFINVNCFIIFLPSFWYQTVFICRKLRLSLDSLRILEKISDNNIQFQYSTV